MTYKFFLPEEDVPEFKSLTGEKPTDEQFQDTLEQIVDKYVSRVYGGDSSVGLRAEPELLARFRYRFVGPIRDVASELFEGGNPLFKRMLQQVLDNDLDREVQTGSLDKNGKLERQSQRRSDFRKKARDLSADFKNRIDIETLTDLVTQTGAEDGGKPILQGSLDESDLMSSLRLFISKGEFDLPAPYNGLGYNNLVYISLVLKSLEFDSDRDRGGQNAVLYPILAVEEPEAHLHPALQYKLLRFIRERPAKGSRQVFITTHSTHVTAASDLDAIICMSAPEGKADPAVSYPGKLFKQDADGIRSKKYVERFLDATKSAMLFAKSVIFVEGLAEQLIIPVLAEYLIEEKDKRAVPLSLERKHVALIGVGGSTFKHFLPVFGIGCLEGLEKYAMPRRVACIVDADPTRKRKDGGRRYHKCWPYEMKADATSFEYKMESGVLERLRKLCAGREDRVQIFPGEKTFEYDFAKQNPDAAILESVGGDDLFDELDGGIKEALKGFQDEDERKAAEFATRYLLSVENSKGESALDLSRYLQENLRKPPDKRVRIVVPDHIARAIRWACGLDEDGV